MPPLYLCGTYYSLKKFCLVIVHLPYWPVLHKHLNE